ncbi:hypothetical protein [Methylobacterium marchantiae]|uniref:Porin n=1 Tax=Methylobacterium marchantiae TaxID=600331 RepID=A0ABW3X0K0_9HYPH|nr:hypothetical protein AIGOOFII_4140 [Methylobacterium marchantiae]
MRAVLMTMSLCLPMVLPGMAKAEDFTGFYAGVNAGYAFGRDRGVRPPDFPSLSSKAAPDASALPPSAVQASEAMKGAKSRAATSPLLR